MFTKQTITRKSIDALSKVCPGVTLPSVAQYTLYGQGNGTQGDPFTWDEFLDFMDSDYSSRFPSGSGAIYYINRSGNLEGTIMLGTVEVVRPRPGGGSGNSGNNENEPKPEQDDVSGNKPEPKPERPDDDTNPYPPVGGGENTDTGNNSNEDSDTEKDEEKDHDLSEVKFKEGINSENISADTIRLLQLSIPGATLVVTSTTRSPREQAEAMVRNIERTGIGEQSNTYAAPGKSVIQVYDSSKSREENISALTAKIYEVGPSSVSKHCADFTKVNVLDVRMSSVPEHQRIAFLSYMRNHPNVSQMLIENNVYHIVVNLP